MKKYINRICLATALLSTGILIGCDDFLTPENRSSVTDQAYFSTASGFQSLVNDTYAQLKDIYNSGCARHKSARCVHTHSHTENGVRSTR